MRTLIGRHLKLFLKDKGNMFFSFLAVFIIIALYLLFLAENMKENLSTFNQSAAFIFLWMFAGIIVVTSVTATLGAFGKFMEDKVAAKNEDLLMSKITPRTLAYSYILYALLIGIIFTVLIIIFIHLYVYFSFDMTLQLTGTFACIIFLNLVLHTVLFYLITNKLSTMSAFSGFSIIVGTAIGFLAGIYLPIGMLPEYMQKIITLIPAAQATSMLRELLMVDILMQIKGYSDFEGLQTSLGIKLQWNNVLIPARFIWLYLLSILAGLFILLFIQNRRIR